MNIINIQGEFSRTKLQTSRFAYGIIHLTNIDWNCLHDNKVVIINELIKINNIWCNDIREFK